VAAAIAIFDFPGPRDLPSAPQTFTSRTHADIYIKGKHAIGRHFLIHPLLIASEHLTYLYIQQITSSLDNGRFLHDVRGPHLVHDVLRVLLFAGCHPFWTVSASFGIATDGHSDTGSFGSIQALPSWLRDFGERNAAGAFVLTATRSSIMNSRKLSHP
jgi:hypothetical protein